ncbi:hypothetical protein AAG570_005396 [Ranatra chinensis]|uniref:Reverse transcriptase n=1 Tax=Ranatra chinensis TaxID=642074 RepID=A0ABD0Y0B7_9HEMI
MASERRNMFYETKKQETTEIGDLSSIYRFKISVWIGDGRGQYDGRYYRRMLLAIRSVLSKAREIAMDAKTYVRINRKGTLLFSLFISDMVDFFSIYDCLGEALESAKDLIMLQYADDLVVLAHSWLEVGALRGSWTHLSRRRSAKPNRFGFVQTRNRSSDEGSEFSKKDGKLDVPISVVSCFLLPERLRLITVQEAGDDRNRLGGAGHHPGTSGCLRRRRFEEQCSKATRHSYVSLESCKCAGHMKPAHEPKLRHVNGTTLTESYTNSTLRMASKRRNMFEKNTELERAENGLLFDQQQAETNLPTTG